MSKRGVKIGRKTIRQGARPFIIAEMSGNHNRSLDRALAIVRQAKKCGCDALKIQTYTADTITIDCRRKEFFIEDKKSLWEGVYLYDLYKEAFTPWEWHKAIFDECRAQGLIAFSTPFDESAVDFLEKLNVPAYKIASFENNHLPLLKKVAQTGKPVIMSTGMAGLEEIKEAVAVMRDNGCGDVVLLKCTSAYPSRPREANLMTIKHLSDVFGCPVGLSDHSSGIGVAVAAVALGAAAVEKHFTLDRAEGGVDAAFSLEPREMSDLVRECRRARQALGTVSFRLSAAEKYSVRFRRSIFVIEDIARNEKLTPKNIRVIRPGDGLAPKDYETVLGMRAKHKIGRGTPLAWKDIKKG